MVEKLTKALEGLKNIQFTAAIEDTAIRKKEKMLSCALVADVMVSLRFTNAQNLPQLVGIVVESLIRLCDDKDSDVRMVADESLNRIIRSLSESNMLKVQIELHKEIKRNGPARCLRAALWRFGRLSCYIRPNKGKGHVENLIPCIVEICKREEESVHETLAIFLENTFKVIGVFIQDNDIKTLLKAFFYNLSSSNVAIRRTTAACINSTIKYCRKPHVFNSYVLNNLLDLIIPVNEESSSCLVLGVLGCLRVLLPNLGCDRGDEGISGSFGLRQKKDESLLSVDRLIQTYELCLHYSKNRDHNVVISSLETLNQLLQNLTPQFESLLLSPVGICRSHIHSTKENKIRSRSGSEMSVVCSISGGDEALLTDDSDISFDFGASRLGDDKLSSTKPEEKFELFKDEIKIVENPFKDKLLGEIFGDQFSTNVDSDADSLPSFHASSLLIMSDSETRKLSGTKELSRSNSKDDLCSIAEDDVLGDEIFVDIGYFTDSDVPLKYCARHLTATFLLEGTKNSLRSDRNVRVSIKSLAISCISAIVKLYPSVLNMKLAKTNSQVHNQEMRDIFLFSNHPDPQVRGNVCLLAAYYINAVMLQSKGFGSSDIVGTDYLCVDNLLNIILKGLKDESSTCSRQVLSGIRICMKSILLSSEPKKIFPLLNHLPLLVNSSYWLHKVKLVDVLCELPFMYLNELILSNFYQDEVIETVLFPLLGDEDSRVRTATAECLTKIIPKLYYGNSTLLAFSRDFTSQINNCLKLKEFPIMSNSLGRPFPPFSYMTQRVDFDLNIEGSLSRIVAKLSNSLMVSVNKFYIFGCLEVLKLLTEKYPPTVYLNGWNCRKIKSGCDEESFLTSNLVGAILSLLLASPVTLDLTALTNATTVLGNLFAGHCICNMKSNYQVILSSPIEEPITYWNALKNQQLSVLAEHIFTHTMNILNIYSHLLEEIPLSKATASATTANNLLPLSLTSPIKKQEKKPDREEKTEERKHKNISNYKQSPNYTKLYHLLKSAYNNYKVSLDSTAGEKFIELLESNLNVLCILLEIGTVHDTGRCAEEILSYLGPAISLCSSPSVLCVVQLLKSLFGTNLGCNWEEIKIDESDEYGCTLFANIYQIPSEFLLNRISNHSISAPLECENLTGSRRRIDRKVQNTDKNCLATYIRLFEPMVIKSLQLYTFTNDVTLQSNVLNLLNQLIQLRVNYCLLDTDEIFVSFVIKQFELIEHGQIPGVEKLLPEVFKFLILLSYEKHHSKTIMSTPKIMQLCDGLMASNQPMQTHCIPALFPIVEDVFLSRNFIISAEQKELETQREVVLAMLLRLVEFHEVMNMLTLILNESRTMEEKERWKRWSRQVIDTVLPLAAQDKLHTDTFEGQASFNKLMSSISPNVLRPIDPFLKILFVEPNDYDCSLSLKRWLSRITVIIETLLHVKEDVLLCRLEELSPNINLSTFLPPKKLEQGDPFNVKSTYPKFESSVTFARFIMKVISVTGHKIVESISTSFHIQQQLVLFFLCVFHLLKSGGFHRISNSLQLLMTTEKDLMREICLIYISMLNFAPVLSCQFTYLLALLNYFDQNFWTRILSEANTLSSKLVQICGVISLCDYLCEILSDTDMLQFLLKRNIKEVILFCNETPVNELITAMHRRPESKLLIETISSSPVEHVKDPTFVEKLLRMLEIAHNSHSGFILHLLVKKFIITPYLALSRLASQLACRRAEYLLTLPVEEVFNHLNSEQFHDLINFVNKQKLIKRHYRLMALLNKLSVEVYDIPTIQVSSSLPMDGQQLKSLVLDENWYSALVKERCCQENYCGSEIATLLSMLSSDKIIEIMSCSNFNVNILKDCLLFLGLKRKNSLFNIHTEIKKPIVEEPLYEATVSTVLKEIREIGEKVALMYNRNHCSSLSDDSIVDRLVEDKLLSSRIWKLASSVPELMVVIYNEKYEIEKDSVENLLDFGLICIEIISVLVLKGENMNYCVSQDILENGIICCINIFKNRDISYLISENSQRMKLKSLIRHVYYLLKSFVSKSRMYNVLKGREIMHQTYAYEEIGLMKELLIFVSKGSLEPLLPSYLVNIRDLIVVLCRLPELSTHILEVPQSCETQEIEMLEHFLSICLTVNWTNKQQFEEIWVWLLTVLGFSNFSQNNVSVEESILVMQASAVAVEGITALLKTTMINPVTKKILHHGRDSSAIKNIVDELPLLDNLDPKDQFGDRSHHFLDNLEIYNLTDRYHHGLLSVEYIWTAVRHINNHIPMYENYTSYINDIGLDLTSCVHLLMELFNQWMFQFSPDIRLITSCLKSAIVISDLFTDISQFQWLLDFCLRIERVVISENSVIFPLIILGCCKAISIVLPDFEMCERIRRLMVHSQTVPCRIATIQGLLYLLQSPVVNSATNHIQRFNSSTSSYDPNYVSNIIDIYLPVAVEIIQHFKNESTPVNEEYERYAWSLIFYLLQHYQSHLGKIREEMLNFILVHLDKRRSSNLIMNLLVRGTERLLLTSVIDESFKDQVSNIALDIISHNSAIVSRCGMQLLMIISFLEKRAKDIRLLVTGQEDPERFMRDLEKINVLFEKLKRSYPEEAEVVGGVISYILMDFNASDVLTKVILEFLSPQQPHLKIISGLLFKVFERAELDLLEDWVVFSLPSFIKGLPVTMLVWILNCFFVSASNESWLRSIFPLVRSRLRMAEEEDKKLLCLSGSCFYKQLKNDKQKKMFVETFQNAAKTHSVFSDLLSSL